MQLKLDDDGRAVLDNGRPVYVDSVGRDVFFDPAEMTDTVTRLNNELAEARETLGKTEADRAALKTKYETNTVENCFKTSALVKDRYVVPADLLQLKFGDSFKVEDGQVVAYDQHGMKIYSRKTAGEVAGFDEALEILVDAYPGRDNITRAHASGGGAVGGSARPAAPAMTRAAFSALTPTQQMAHVRSGKGIVD